MDPSPWSAQEAAPTAGFQQNSSGWEPREVEKELDTRTWVQSQELPWSHVSRAAGTAGKGVPGAAPCPTELIWGQRESLMDLQNIYGCPEHKNTGRRSDSRTLVTN